MKWSPTAARARTNDARRSRVMIMTAFLAGCSSTNGAKSPSTGGNQPDGGQGTSEGGTVGGDAGAPVPGVTVVVSPKSVAVNTNATQAYTCTVAGATNTACTWKVTESAGGSIVSSGASTAVYTAPGAAGTYHVVASSAASPATTDTATVTVVQPVVGDCSALPAAGTWQNITPATLNQGEWCTPYGNGCPNTGVNSNGTIGTYGTNAFVLDPNNPGTLYLGTSSLGLWKSTDCGATWAHIDSGSNAAAIDGGRNWTMLIDPTNSQVLYTVSGYDASGVFKSVNGGVDWTQVLTQNVLDATGATPCASSTDSQLCGQSGAFMEKLTMDPTNSQHLLASFHSDCGGTTPLPGATTDSSNGWGCLAETNDSGQTWTLTTNAVPWSGLDGPGQSMVNATTWFYATNSCTGLWRTTTGGVSPDSKSSAWTQVYSGCINGSVYKASNGMFYAGGNNVLWSADGITWSSIMNAPSANSMNGSTPMVDDGHTFYVGGNGGYFSAPLASGSLTFTKISSTPVTSESGANVAYVDYDSAHHVLYSSNMDGGFWRYVTN